MARIVQDRDPQISAFQSAIDEIAVVSAAGGGAQSVGEAIASTDRPGTEDPMVQQAARLALESTEFRNTGGDTSAPGPAPTGPVTEGVGEATSYCASLAFNLAKAKFTGNAALSKRYSDELSAAFGTCDVRYAQAAEQTLVYFNMQKGVIPYRDWTKQSDYVIDDGQLTLPENAVVAVVGDWGTGQEQALRVLNALASKNPDVVIHLGDVYYAGTENEQQHYFFDNWAQILKLNPDPVTRIVRNKRPATYSLPGNHDMYCGGAPYYKMIQQLGQPASFFCLRNKHWQFIGLDTGFYDHGLSGPPTHLPPRQPEWLADKMQTAGGRKTVLLSHHQLFSNQESFPAKAGGAGAVNESLMAEVEPILADVSLWLWGHQHQFVAYNDPRVKGRCMGHGAYPVGITEIAKASTAIAIDTAITAQKKGDEFWDNGYTLLQLAGANAKVTYYAVDENGDERPNPSSEEI